ncbi:hypothetical protein LCGC14_2070250 [marine sediment metagenome]|uniref:NadR/Ttd14 AAA domain-containing protein n=1 Tax=marine sediment metagenome TaxID=412755 RepID=A0A0F9HFP0_9ZZZZ
MTLVVNLFGGPGTGKSTTAAGVFHQLKLQGINCEMALEYAKDKVWEESAQVLDNQLYVFGKQFHRIWRLLGKVDIIITDSPLLNSILYYEDKNPFFPEMVVFEHSRLNNLDVLLGRVKEYNPAGRLQTEEKARDLDDKIRGILDIESPTYINVTADASAVDVIVAQALLHWATMIAVEDLE